MSENAIGTLIIVLGVVLLFNGWPRFINIEKHYYDKNGNEKDND